jgi:hypothetical protein
MPEVLQSAPVRRCYLAGITGWNFAEHTFLIFKACLFSEIFIHCAIGDEECSTGTLLMVEKRLM